MSQHDRESRERFERERAANASKKAFVTTRIGDTFLMLGIALVAIRFGTLDLPAVLEGAGTLSAGAATAIALLLFGGAVGKSAQVPLHVWLPYAMEGPTPVSALIHAATMVTAGVYLVARTHAIFEVSGIALTVVMVVGLVTALYAALVAIGQDDIKRVLAYSTISQLGFMFLALGLRAFDVQGAGWLHGLKIVAVAVVAQAVWGMARSLAPDRPRATIAVLAAIAVLTVPTRSACSLCANTRPLMLTTRVTTPASSTSSWCSCTVSMGRPPSATRPDLA